MTNAKYMTNYEKYCRDIERMGFIEFYEKNYSRIADDVCPTPDRFIAWLDSASKLGYREKRILKNTRIGIQGLSYVRREKNYLYMHIGGVPKHAARLNLVVLKDSQVMSWLPFSSLVEGEIYDIDDLLGDEMMENTDD